MPRRRDRPVPSPPAPVRRPDSYHDPRKEHRLMTRAFRDLDATSDSQIAAPNLWPAFRVLTALLLFGASFGFVEAAVVSYLRAVYDPLHAQIFPDSPPGSMFPLI